MYIGVKFIFAWYDMWVGAYYNRDYKELYILPLPCIGMRIYKKLKLKPLAGGIFTGH